MRDPQLVVDAAWPHRTQPITEDDMTNDEHDALTRIDNRTANLEGAVGGLIDIGNAIKADVENPDSHGGAGQISSAGVDAIVNAELAASRAD